MCRLSVGWGEVVRFWHLKEGIRCLLETGYFFRTGCILFVCLLIGGLVTLSGIFELPKVTFEMKKGMSSHYKNTFDLGVFTERDRPVVTTHVNTVPGSGGIPS